MEGTRGLAEMSLEKFKFKTVASVKFYTEFDKGARATHVAVLKENGLGRRRVSLSTSRSHLRYALDHGHYVQCEAWRLGGPLPDSAVLADEAEEAKLYVIDGGAA